jgi:hypothetical protein
MGSTVTVGTVVVMSVDVGGTDVTVCATVGVIAGAPHPMTNNIRNARLISGNNFLLSILVSII